MDERMVVRLCKNGHREYFDQLVAHYEQPLYRYCLHLSGQKEKAMDLFQETWLKAVAKIDRYNEDYPLKQWLYKIATNTYRDFFRREKRKTAVFASFRITKDLDNILRSVSSEEVEVPVNLALMTSKLLKTTISGAKKAFPFIVSAVFLMNILISLFFGGILFLIRPITLFEWIIIGAVYSTINVLLYTLTFIYYEKLQDMLHAYSKGGI